jgi:hypothetical protein
MWERLLDAIQYAAKQAVPRKQIKQGCKPWFNPSLLAKLRVFRRAKNRYFNNKSTGNYEAYIIARNAWDQHRRIARDDNIDRIASKLTNERNSKLNWSIWKQVTAPSASPLSAHSANGPPRTKKEALDNLGAFFAQTMTDRKDTDFSHTIGEFTDNVLFKNIKPHPLDTPFTLKEVATQCARAKEGTALGPDDVHPLFLRHAGPTFLSALLELFNRSWNLGLVPSAWKHSKAVAIYKGKGGRDDPSNYRLICVTSIVSRTFEHIVLRRLCSHLTTTRFLHPGQAGFRPKFSTYDNIYRLQRSIYKALQDQSHRPVVFLDISKAFDSVWHYGLLQKVHDSAGIKGKAWLWIRSFLNRRSFSIVDKGCSSASFSTTAGVPQGCVLSPLLFLIFINDLPKQSSLKDVEFLLFADDIAPGCLGRGGEMGQEMESGVFNQQVSNCLLQPKAVRD